MDNLWITPRLCGYLVLTFNGGPVSKQELRILYKQGKLTTKEYFLQLSRILKASCPPVPKLDVVEFFGDLDFPLKTGV